MLILRHSEAAAAKAAEAARKKAEKEALLKEEEASLPSKPQGNKKTAVKKSRGLDLSSLDDEPSNSKKGPALNATGIDNALDALDLTSNNTDKIDRHPERRFKAAYNAFEERRLEEMKDEKGLRRQQKIDQIRKVCLLRECILWLMLTICRNSRSTPTTRSTKLLDLTT